MPTRGSRRRPARKTSPGRRKHPTTQQAAPPKVPAVPAAVHQTPRPQATNGHGTVEVEDTRHPDLVSIMIAVVLVAIVAVPLSVHYGGAELVRAMRVWAQGRSASAEPLWGHTVLWWARAGKIMEFAAGLVVVLDLIGPERLRRSGRRARERAARAQTQLVRMRRMPEQTPHSAVLMAMGFFLVGINAFLLILLVPNWSLLAKGPSVIAPFVVAPIVLVAFLVVGGPEKSAGARVPLLGLAWIFTRVVLGPPIAILDKANPGYLLRWLSLLLFVVGFGLDLLGS